MVPYSVTSILTEEETDKLLQVYRSLPSSLAHQDYNLFDVDKRSVPKSMIDDPNLPFKKIDQFADLKLMGCYFVEYSPESWTKLHTDDDGKVGLTIVTMVDTKHLVGGETLVALPYTKNARPADRYRKGESPAGDDLCVLSTIDVSDGQSMIYGPKLRHGVAQVRMGTRLVLVNWYFKDGYDATV
tara:strand:+ start:11608 stop:12162 length:555 start_codon:yes stop_codon:yes gene_type:complete